MSLIRKHMASLLCACYAIGKLILTLFYIFRASVLRIMCDSCTIVAKLNQIIIIVYVLVGHEKILQTD